MFNLLGLKNGVSVIWEHIDNSQLADYRPVDVITQKIIELVSMPSNKEELIIDSINLSLQYRDFYTTENVEINDFITDDGIKFKIFSKAKWGAFNLLNGEQIK